MTTTRPIAIDWDRDGTIDKKLSTKMMQVRAVACIFLRYKSKRNIPMLNIKAIVHRNVLDIVGSISGLYQFAEVLEQIIITGQSFEDQVVVESSVLSDTFHLSRICVELDNTDTTPYEFDDGSVIHRGGYIRIIHDDETLHIVGADGYLSEIVQESRQLAISSERQFEKLRGRGPVLHAHFYDYTLPLTSDSVGELMMHSIVD